MNNNLKTEIIMFIIGSILIIWLALLIAPFADEGLIGIINNFPNVMNNPYEITWCENSIKTILILLLVYIISVGVYASSKKNYRRNEEYGSSKWGNPFTINKKYMQKPVSANKLLTQNVKLGLNAKAHRRNLNVLVCGGSGAGKTIFYCKPNIMQANTSFICLDPKRRDFKRYW